MTQSLMQDLLIILAAGLLAGVVCRRFGFTVLVGYLIAGALLGDGGFGLILDRDGQLEHFAEAGAFLLLFSIGLEFSIDDLRRLGRHLAVGGSVQMTLVALPLAAALKWYGLEWNSAALISAALAFSSTVLVFKALSERGQTGTAHGRRAIGVLLFQDAALVPLLLLVPMLTGSGAAVGPWEYAVLGIVSVLFVMAVIGSRYVLARWLIPMFAELRSPELIIFSTLVALGGVTLAAHAVGLPPAVGAFAAGLIFNGNRWTKQIDALVLPFRETFAAIFFIGLGLIFDPRLIWQEPLWMFGTLAGVMVLKAAAAGVALRLTGLSTRKSFAMGLGLAHVGEFAFVLILLGVNSGVLDAQEYQRVVAIAVGSLLLTPAILSVGLRQIRDPQNEDGPERPDRDLVDKVQRATVIGAGPIGRQVASQLDIMGLEICLIDLSPINLQPFAQEGFHTVAGDATDEGLLELAKLNTSHLIVVCVPDDNSALRIIRAARRVNPHGRLLVRCRYQSNSEKLKAAGAERVVSEEAEASLALMQLLHPSPLASQVKR